MSGREMDARVERSLRSTTPLNEGQLGGLRTRRGVEGGLRRRYTDDKKKK